MRHYFLISVVLISGGLVTSGLGEIYFRYRESREQIALLHQEVAAGAAFKIERFVQEIEGTMRAATKTREILLKGLTPEYRFELEKLLTIARPITEVMALDANGLVGVQASRLRAVFPVEQRDHSRSGAFHQAREGKSYFGPVYFVRGSEPYMTIAVPIERFAGEVIGVLQAEVNLKYIWDVVSGVKVGRAGYAYAVTRSGDLIAHQDIGLVLQQRDVAQLEQVKAAFRPTSGTAGQTAIVAHNLQEERVFSSYALIPALDWAVFAELPMEEAYGPILASIFRTSSLLLIGLGMALLASVFVARRVVRPLGKLREGVGRIGSGDLDFRVHLKTGDELESLAEEFNKMSGALREAYAGLEQKVADTGPGIPVQEAERIFDKFYQTAEAGRQKPKGTGLGLAISKALVEMHGGKIWVDVRVTRGSTFHFTLPIHGSESVRGVDSELQNGTAQETKNGGNGRNDPDRRRRSGY